MMASLETGASGSPERIATPPLTGTAFLVAAIRTLLTYVIVGAYVLLLGPIGLLVAFLTKSPDLLFVLAQNGVRLGLALAGIRYRVTGAEHLPRNRPVVFCANHVSNLDPPLLFLVLHRRLRLLYKAEFGKVPVLGRAIRLGGFIAVERSNPEQGHWAVEQAVRALQGGQTFLVFPEGTRSRTGELLPFKKGSFIMALKAQVPVVPVAMEGGRAAMAKGSKVIRPVAVHVRIGTPIDTAGMTIDDRERVAAMTRDQIEQMLRG